MLTNTDLNAEINNILDNLGPAGIDDYSTNAAQMKLQTSPGSLGSESLATSLAGEIERLRYVIQRIIGSDVTYWYQTPGASLSDLIGAVGSGLPTYRIVSGRETGNSSQLCALIPSGTTASVVLSASVTPFIYNIAGTQYTISTNVTLSGISTAASTNNTCSLNDTAAGGQQWTKFLGMYDTQIDVDGMNSNIAAVTGQLAGFKSGDEYFLAYVDSTLALTNAMRGAFFNQSANNITAVGLSDNAEIKLMKLAWIFANTSAALAVTYNNPTISAEQPSGGAIGDYWFDLATTTWKTFNSTSWVDANALLIGITMQDTAACVAARTLDAYSASSELNNMGLKRVSNTVVQASQNFAEVNIFGTTNRFGVSRPVWDITTDLNAGETETVNMLYYLYMKENGTTLISERAPLHMRERKGLYYPGETWRCLGNIRNDASTHFETPVRMFQPGASSNMLLGGIEAYVTPSSSTAAISSFIVQGMSLDNYIYNVGQSFTHTTTGSPMTVSSVSLSPGYWRLFASSQLVGVGTAQIIHQSAWSFQIQIPGIIEFGDGVMGATWRTQNTMSATVLNMYASVPAYIVALTAAQTIELISAFTSTPGTCSQLYSWMFGAERLDKLIGVPG